MIAALVAFSALFVFTVSSVASRAPPAGRHRVGSVREVLDDGLLLHDGKTEGWARMHGERWRVSSAEPHAAGRRVRVTGRRGLMLTVVPVVDQQQGEPS
jgi:membrane-bound serine protease (ClpP class)